jgi:hypothetical protein
MVAPVPAQIAKHRLPPHVSTPAVAHHGLLRAAHDPLFSLSVLCFHNLTNCFSRKSFVLITIRIARGCHLCALRAPTSVPSVLRFFRVAGATCFISYYCELFVIAKKVKSFAIRQIQTLFKKYPGWGVATVPAFWNERLPGSLIRPPAWWKPAQGYQCE